MRGSELDHGITIIHGSHHTSPLDTRLYPLVSVQANATVSVVAYCSIVLYTRDNSNDNLGMLLAWSVWALFKRELKPRLQESKPS
jgi:hypothetical protein